MFDFLMVYREKHRLKKVFAFYNRYLGMFLENEKEGFSKCWCSTWPLDYVVNLARLVPKKWC